MTSHMTFKGQTRESWLQYA